eukprot:CAMPEP_0117746756 /NCGR_PEP_ID=MMETSP0947-20121206/8127_1 /TAXON_ID=44440 /ORGANISM="Chattonella subsalsa, Strain CCMP2191" /LENGTH=480 /DNA_ID=CAMNT_0005564123 /DNA_START=83 /DNA_END=1525 /DNA_ORIENTATION=-
MMWQTLALFVLFFILIEFLVKLRRVHHLVGPLPLPIIGNCYDFGIFTSIKYLQKLRKRYGKVFCFWAGSKPTIVICEPQVVRHILTNPKVFPKSKDYIDTFGASGFGNGLVTSPEEVHRKDRALFTRFFNPKYLEQKLPSFNQQIRFAIDEIILPNLGKPFDIQEFFHITALRIFGEHAMSIDYSRRPEQANWGVKYCKLGSEVVGGLMMKGLPYSKVFSKVRALNRERKVWYGILDEEIRKRKAHMAVEDNPKIDDCLTKMIEEKMSRLDMFDHLTTLCAAGHDTTAFFGCYLTYILALHPEVQKKAKAEVRNTLAGRSELTAADVQTLLKGYLGLVLQETLRLYSVIPFIKREATEARRIKMGKSQADLLIPAGVELLLPICLMNRDSDIWQDPNEFIPERWEGLTANPIKHGFFSFSYGTRSCIGMNMAKIEMMAMIGMLLMKYSFHKVEGFKPKIVGGISLVSSNGIFVKVLQDPT